MLMAMSLGMMKKRKKENKWITITTMQMVVIIITETTTLAITEILQLLPISRQTITAPISTVTTTTALIIHPITTTLAYL